MEEPQCPLRLFATTLTIPAHGRLHVPEVAVYEADSITKQEGRSPVYTGGAWSDYENKRTYVGE